MHNTTLQNCNWNYPTSIWFGADRVQDINLACEQLGIKQPLLVTDAGLVKLPMVQDLLSLLQQLGTNVGVFSDVKPNPTGKNITQGVKAYKKGNHDGVIAFGGGSSLDAGKAIALMVGQSRSLWDFEDVGDNWKRVKEDGVSPIIAVPTTAGTGSEVGRASVIHDEDAVLKKIIFHPKMLPEIVIIDPALTTGLSPQLTAATGMDALSHNVEAFCASAYHPLADGIAIEGIRLINENLEVAVHDGTNLTARAHMLNASMMGATAFQKGLGAMHALAHPLGATYDAHHGMLNAILMPYVLKHNANAIQDKMALLSRVLKLQTTSVDAVIDWVLDLRQKIGIPNTLKDIGIDDSKILEIAKKAVDDPSSSGNPVAMNQFDYEKLLKSAITG